MARTHAIKVEGVVIQALPNGTCIVKLSNGHQLVAWSRQPAMLAGLAPGKRVMLEVSPYNLSHGRLLEEIKTET